MKSTNPFCTFAVAAVLLCVTSNSCLAGVIVSESGSAVGGDTGDLVGGVVLDLTTSLDVMTIEGTLGSKPSGPDIDAYKIRIGDTANFSVTLFPPPFDPLAPSDPLGLGPADPILYLFDSDLNAVVADNDHDAFGFDEELSKISAGTIQMRSPGDYFLVVTSFAFESEVLPLSTTGFELFDPIALSADSGIFGPFPATVSPTPKDLNLEFGSWLTAATTDHDKGKYVLQFTGLATTSSVVPEPTSALIWAASGLVMLPTFRRRRRLKRNVSR